tara:strand:- start:559 stop:789 length:231 start_codon:yes stop_codon:yes gene_type:complete
MLVYAIAASRLPTVFLQCVPVGTILGRKVLSDELDVPSTVPAVGPDVLAGLGEDGGGLLPTRGAEQDLLGVFDTVG